MLGLMLGTGDPSLHSSCVPSRKKGRQGRRSQYRMPGVAPGEHKKSSKISIYRLCGLLGGSSKRTNPRPKNGPQRRVSAGLDRGSWRAKQGWAPERFENLAYD